MLQKRSLYFTLLIINELHRVILELPSGVSRISQNGGANPRKVYENLLFGKIFAENCMKIKEIEPRVHS